MNKYNSLQHSDLQKINGGVASIVIIGGFIGSSAVGFGTGYLLSNIFG